MRNYRLFELKDRFMIDQTPLPMCHGVVEARCWIEAKQLFGYELTPIQKEMLAKLIDTCN